MTHHCVQTAASGQYTTRYVQMRPLTVVVSEVEPRSLDTAVELDVECGRDDHALPVARDGQLAIECLVLIFGRYRAASPRHCKMLCCCCHVHMRGCMRYRSWDCANYGPAIILNISIIGHCGQL
mmetsp:Transcript_50409/g.131189  ORF Transcript_50409/g.131189 Transcript_50409/m.131189 type:complete len:124 (-) Transcript_50409:1621-1992(-)